MLALKILGIALAMAGSADMLCGWFPALDQRGVFFVAGTLFGIIATNRKTER